MRHEMKYRAIHYLYETEHYSIIRMCERAQITRAAYYKWLKREPSTRQLENEEVVTKIREVYEEQDGILGYGQMTIAINRRFASRYNHKRIYRLMSIIGLKAVCRKKRYNYQKSTPQVTAEKAVGKFPNTKPVFHSDRGFQYTSKTFRAKLDRAGMQQSMSRAGRCIDNGPMEGFWGILKSEMYYLRKFNDHRSLKTAVEHYIDFYNHRRYQKRLKCMAPMEYIKAMAA